MLRHAVKGSSGAEVDCAFRRVCCPKGIIPFPEKSCFSSLFGAAAHPNEAGPCPPRAPPAVLFSHSSVLCLQSAAGTVYRPPVNLSAKPYLQLYRLRFPPGMPPFRQHTHIICHTLIAVTCLISAAKKSSEQFRCHGFATEVSPQHPKGFHPEARDPAVPAISIAVPTP